MIRMTWTGCKQVVHLDAVFRSEFRYVLYESWLYFHNFKCLFYLAQDLFLATI